MTEHKVTVELAQLRIRPRPDSPIPECVFRTLPEGEDTALDVYWQLQRLKAQGAYPEAATTWEQVLRITMDKVTIPIRLRRDGEEWVVTSGELGVIAAMHRGETTATCIVEEEATPAPRPVEAGVAKGTELDAQIANFAGWLRARPQPPGFELADTACSLVSQLEQSLRAEEIWSVLFGKQFGKMPQGWTPTATDRRKAAVLSLAERARCEERTISRLLRISQLPSRIRQITPSLSARKLRLICRLQDPAAQVQVAEALTHRPLSTRQLQELVALCNKNISVAEALQMIDQEETGSLEEVVALMDRLLDLLDHLSSEDVHFSAFMTRWQACRRKVEKLLSKTV